ncbi:uncharacterized protein [Hemitrygon akajei]|uniref:uncharacterized protein isoform X3 n=1 Tax=Hemitrygon akajei TaxID=2704970 RepID=UPI003BF9849C
MLEEPSRPGSIYDNTVKVINVSYASQHMGNCWFNFKYYNITYDDIHLSINDRTILNSDGYVPPVMNFSKPEGFKVEGCQTVSMRCHKDGVETIYKIQVKEEGGDGNGNWKIWVAVGFVSLFLVCLILGLFCYRKVRRRNKYHLPFCCESRMKDPIEDPAVEQNLCESQETLQSEQLTGCADPRLPSPLPPCTPITPSATCFCNGELSRDGLGRELMCAADGMDGR